MNRVEKYAEYRDEINNSFTQKTTKETTSERVSEILKKTDTGKVISYADVMETYEIYDKDEDKKLSKKHAVDKNRIIFIVICLIAIICLIIAMIFVGIKAFGGN